jgi:hypothetical protein
MANTVSSPNPPKLDSVVWAMSFDTMADYANDLDWHSLSESRQDGWITLHHLAEDEYRSLECVFGQTTTSVDAGEVIQSLRQYCSYAIDGPSQGIYIAYCFMALFCSDRSDLPRDREAFFEYLTVRAVLNFRIRLVLKLFNSCVMTLTCIIVLPSYFLFFEED